MVNRTDYSSINTPIIQSLPTGSLDIIGDVHGEWEALHQLLYHLGYTESAQHPNGRKLVFVGDLCDRGPDSPAILEWIQEMRSAERVWCVLGNHELNLITHSPKDGSGWYFTNRRQDEALYAPWQCATPEQKDRIYHSILDWPIILYRDDLRIVHASWHAESIEKLYQTNLPNVLAQYHYWEQQFTHTIQHTDWYDGYLKEQEIYQRDLESSHAHIPPLPYTAHYEALRSNFNPIRTITSGIEAVTAQPFFASGRWRFTNRIAWWNDYHDDIPVIIGHYWRHWHQHPYPKHRKSLFPKNSQAWMGCNNTVFCLDYSIGGRWRDRLHNTPPEQSHFHLAAMRWPEKILTLENGRVASTHQSFQSPSYSFR